MYHIKLFMKQVNLVAALLLFSFSAFAQTVTPDPGPYAPMNQKYEYRWIKTSGGLWNLGKLIVQDSTDLRSITYVTTAPDNDSSKRVASTAWVKKNITAGGSGGIDSVRRKGVTDSIVEFYGGALGFRRFAFTAPLPGSFVPYTGATQDVNLGEFGLQTGNVEFDNTPTNLPTSAGSMYYNDSDGTLDLILKGGNVKLQIGQESVVRVVNKTATNINLLEANYQAVRVTGAQGQRLKVDLAQATTDPLSAETIGLVTETINNNQEGFITTSGLVRNINTTGSLQGETWADGDIIYLSPTVAGRITNIKPSAPNHLVIIGYVIHAHATQGSIFVKVDNGYELDELHNVKITTPTNNQALVFNDTTDVWENKSLVTVSSYGKNAGGDSTVLVLSNGVRYAAKDSTGGGGGSQWTDNANGINYNGGNVGIGTTTPASLLNIVANASDTSKGIILRNSTAATLGTPRFSPQIILEGNSFINPGAGNVRNYWSIQNQTSSGTSGASSLIFANSNNNAAPTTLLSISPSGGITSTASASFNGNILGNEAWTSNGRVRINASGDRFNADFFSYNNNANQQNPLTNAGNYITHDFKGGITTTTTTATANHIFANFGGTENWSTLSAATWEGMRINITETSNPTGQKYLFRAGKGGGSFTSLFDITSTGQVMVGTATPNASAALNVTSTTQGVLFPRMTLTQRNAIASPSAGLQVVVTGETGGEFVSMWNSTAAAWVNATSKWSTNANGINYNGGRVGIGTATPAQQLHIVGTSSQILVNTNNQSAAQVRVQANSANFGNLIAFDATAGFGLASKASVSSNTSLILIGNGDATGSTTTNIELRPGGYSTTDAIGRATLGGLVLEAGNTTAVAASAILEARSTTKGVLFPRMTTVQKLAIVSPAAGLQVYDTTLNQMSYYNGTTWVNF